MFSYSCIQCVVRIRKLFLILVLLLLLSPSDVANQQQQHPFTAETRAEQDELIRGIQNMSLALHGIQETLPSVIVGHVVTPSTASRNRQVSTRILDAVGMSPFPDTEEEVYTLPAELQQTSAWKFSFKWPSISNDDKMLERTSYEPVLNFLLRLGLYAEDVSEGQNCIDKLLYNSDIYTPRKENPLEVRGQRVFHCHRVQGRTDLVVLRTRRHGGPIIRNMVEFAIEIKTVASLQQSQDGCLLEAQLQLIGLNAFNTLKSPPVVLSNLAKTHHVVYLDYNQDGWSYVIKRKKCSTFAAAIHFARKVAKERSISSNFSRPMTPEQIE